MNADEPLELPTILEESIIEYVCLTLIKKVGRRYVHHHVSDWTWKHEDLDRLCSEISRDTGRINRQEVHSKLPNIMRMAGNQSACDIKEVCSVNMDA